MRSGGTTSRASSRRPPLQHPPTRSSLAGVATLAQRWLTGSFTAFRVALARPELRRVQLAWAASASGEFVSIVALGVFAYEAGGAAAVGGGAVVQMVPAM